MIPMPFGGAPVRATLIVHDPPAGSGNSPGPERHRLRLHFNPERISVSTQARWERSRAAAKGVPRPQYISTEPRSMSLEVFLDGGDGRSGVQADVELLLGCCFPTPKSAVDNGTSAPWVRLEWGRSRTTAFFAYVSQANAAYTRFAHDGTPLRATCHLTLTEVGGATPGQNPTSGADGPTGVHRVVAGDSLPLIAWRAYGYPPGWRAIAEVNDIDDPARLELGSVLSVPVLEGDDDGGH
ncbi:LysM peptidoglycan-binding domain-containing protein [Kitasatospora sp. NPDC056327]|uniref:CIS tube protein n=1 Tax=Kitasatospora sp. NPDC056327 TaxID=3345785 RepID=UPI0035D6C16C